MSELVWYHATTSSRKKLIQKDSFDLKKCGQGIWGRGVYLSDSYEDSLKYGTHVVEASISDECIAKFEYEKLVGIIPDLLIEEEAGDPILKDIITRDLKKQAAAITYSDGITHLIVYKPEHLKIS